MTVTTGGVVSTAIVVLVVDEVVLRGLAREPDRRYESAAAFREALIALAPRPPAAAVSEHTLIMEPIRPSPGTRSAASRFGDAHTGGLGSSTANPSIGRTGASASGTGTSRSGTGTSRTGTGYPDHWDPTTLAQIESRLARHIGPVAKVLIRRAAVETSDLVDLRHRLAAHLDNDVERSQFLEGSVAVASPPRAGVSGATALAAGTAGVVSADWDPAILAELESKLARFIGPVARVLVRRAAPVIGDFGALVHALGDELANESERKQFFASTAAIVPRLAQRRSVDAGATGTTLPAPAWDSATLAPLEVALARLIGPRPAVLPTARRSPTS